MQIISVVTPVHAPSVRYLAEAYESLVAQEMPAGWSWQWVVQEDGEDGILDGVLPADERISPGANRKGGPGVTRTMTLSRAAGELVKVFDADDVLAPGALARDIATLGDPGVDWTVSRVLDLLPDGSTAAFDGDPDEGPIERGAVLRFWRAHDHLSSVHGASLCIRRPLLLALGGWMALPASEDTGLVLAANAVSDGYFIATCGLFYRKWPGQVTQHAAHRESVEHAARMRIIGERADALLSLTSRHS